jgi:hypothetical protein
MSQTGAPLPTNYAAQVGVGSTIKFLPSGAPIIANMADMSTYATTQWNNWEFVNGSLYDSASYVAAGQTSLTFFQTPQGGGTGFGGGSKTLSDTNMVLNGMLATGNMFVASSIEVEFQPTTPSVTAALPAVFGAQAVAAQINDAYVFWRSGNLVFRILQKNYLEEAPLMQFPSQADFSLQGAFADATTAAAASQSRLGFASAYGPVFSFAPNNLLIPETTNFRVTLGWPEGVQAITNPGRVFVRLRGMQARQAQ